MDFGERSRKKHTWLYFVGILLGVGILVVVKSNWLGGYSQIVSPLPDNPKPILSIPRLSSKKDPEELKKKIQNLVEKQWRNYSVLVEDYNSDFTAAINSEVMYVAASVNKVPILAVLYYYAQKGEVNLDETITIQPADIQDYGTGVIRYDPPGTTYTIKTLAQLMMQKSDNTAAYILANYTLGLDKIQTTLESLSLTQTLMNDNKTSNRDMALLFRKIASEKIANRALTLEMLSFLQDTDQEDRLPAQLPKNVTVYHKTGNGIGGVHDVGLITTDKKKYYLGMFTSDIVNEEETVKLMAEVSKLVWNYLN